MAYLPTNSTDSLLLANQEFIGEAVAVDKEYISVTCSFNSNVGGVLLFFHSIDGFSFSSYGDVYDFTSNPGSHSIEVSVKGKYFKIRYINGSQNQSVFNLFCKLNVTVGEAILNSTYDSITVYAGETGLNIRQLTTDDKVSIPRLEQTLTSDSGVSALQCKITSMPPIVIPPISIGEINIKDSNGGDILANSNGYLQTQIMNSSLTVNTISGFATSVNQVTAQSSLNSLVNGVRIQASNGNNITVDSLSNLKVVEKNSTDILSGITAIQTAIEKNTYDIDNNLQVKIMNTSVNADVGCDIVELTQVSDLATKKALITASNIFAYNADGGTVETITFSNTSYLDNENVKNRLDVSTTIVDYQSSDYKCNIMPTNAEDLAGKNGVVSDAILFGTKTDGSIHGIEITDNYKLKVESNLITGFATELSLSALNYKINNDDLNTSAIQVQIKNDMIGISGNVIIQNLDASLDSVAIYGNDGTNNILIKTDNLGKILIGDTVTVNGNITVDSMPSIDATNNSITIYGSDGITNYAIRTNNLGQLETVLPNGITVNNFPTSFEISNGITVNNFPTSIEISNGITVNNFPTSIEVSNLNNRLIATLAGGATALVNCYTDTNVTPNLNYLYTNDKLLNDKITNTTITGETGTQVYITNTGSHPVNVGLHATHNTNITDLHCSSQGGLYCVPTDESGHHQKIDNSGTAQVGLFDSQGNAISSTSGTGSVQSLDVYVQSGNVNSILYAGSNQLTSTSNGIMKGLDVNIINSGSISTSISNTPSVTLSGTSTVNIKDSNGSVLSAVSSSIPQLKTTLYDSTGTELGTNTKSIYTNIKDSSGNVINAITTAGNVNGAVKTALVGNTNNTIIGDTNATAYGGITKNGLNTFIINGVSTPVLCGGYDGTNNQVLKTTSTGILYTAIDSSNNTVGLSTSANTVKLDTSNNTIKIDSSNNTVGLSTSANTIKLSQSTTDNNIKITDAAGDVATVTIPINETTIKGLDTNSYLLAYNKTSGTNNNLTSTIPTNPDFTTSKALDVMITNNGTTVEKSIFGSSSNYRGINVYSVQPRCKQLVMSGNTSTVNGMLSGHNGNLTISTYDWGISKAKTFYITMNATSTAKTFYYDYVDTNGNERTGTYTISAPLTSWYQLPLQSGYTESMVGINNVRVSSSLTTNEAYFISTSAAFGNTVCSGTYGRTFNAVITIPNNAVGYVSNIYMYNASVSFYNLYKCDAITGARKNIYYHNTAFATNQMSAGCDGALGGYLQSGEAVFGGNETANSMTVFANVVIKYLS